MERVDRGMGRSSSLGSLSGRSLHKSTRHRRDEGPRSCDSTANMRVTMIVRVLK